MDTITVENNGAGVNLSLEYEVVDKEGCRGRLLLNAPGFRISSDRVTVEPAGTLKGVDHTLATLLSMLSFLTERWSGLLGEIPGVTWEGLSAELVAECVKRRLLDKSVLEKK